jgi:hypothetical protein
MQVQIIGETVQWVETAQYFNVTLDNIVDLVGACQHVNQAGRRVAQTLGVFGPLFNKRSGLCTCNSVLLYKQLFHPMMDYTCPI